MDTKDCLSKVEPSTPQFQKFADLPPEIRFRIYGHAIGNRMLHIAEQCYIIEPGRGLASRLGYSPCRCKLSEVEIYESQASPVTFKNKVDKHMRPRGEPMELAHEICGTHAHPWEVLTLGLLQATKEAKTSAIHLLYTSNIFSFDNSRILQEWLAKVPPQFLTLIRHMRLEMHPQGHVKNADGSSAAAWSRSLAALPFQVPNLQTLHLVICLQEPVACWMKSQKEAFEEMFVPLRSCKDLKTFTVVLFERYEVRKIWANAPPCHQLVCDEDVHGTKSRAIFWEWKEVRRLWAEEIRAVVLVEAE